MARNELTSKQLASLASKVSLPLQKDAHPSEDGRTGVDDRKIDSAMDLGEHTDQAFEGEPLGASVSKIGHAPLVDTEELRGDNGREVVYEP